MKKNLLYLFILSPIWVFCQFHQPDIGEVFRDDVIPRIDISIHPDSLDWILDDDNIYSDHLFQVTFIFDNGTILDTLENIGFRLRGNTSRQADKKSFKVDFNAFESGRKYYGLEKMNLNGQHNDPSVSRAKIGADLARDMNIPSLRSNHVELYINDAYHGLYINVEHVDEEYVDKRFGNKNGNLYKCLYPADLDYKGDDPDLYKEEFWGRRAYELKTNTTTDDYSDFAHFVDVLNNTPTSQLPCLLEPIFNVDQYLRFMVFDILTGNWDGPIYNKNNFYLYQNESSGKFEYIPFDLDNTLGIDWLDRDWGTRAIYTWHQSNNPRPIFTRIIVVPEYRKRFSYYMNETISNYFNEAILFPYFEDMKNSISTSVAMDTFYNMDYGFTFSDFNTSFDNPLPYYQVEDYGIKSYIITRKSTALSQLVLGDIAPVITERSHNYPSVNEDIVVTAKILDDNAITHVEVCYSLLVSTTFCTDMYDDGMHQDGVANDGIYGAIIPALDLPTAFEISISATDDAGQQSMSPVCGSEIFYIEDSNVPLAINEFMASNSETHTDEYGEFDDWVEIYNYGDSPIYLGNKFLSDNQAIPDKWQMPNISINPNEYIVFWADNDVEQGSHHTNFKLSAGGEFIGIFDDENANFALIDGIDFEAQETNISFGRIPNGTGDFISMPHSPGASNFITYIEELNTLHLRIESFPNPISELYNLEINNPEQHELSINISNATGQKIFQQSTNNSISEKIYLNEYPSGIYFLIVNFGDRIIYTQKLIKI